MSNSTYDNKFCVAPWVHLHVHPNGNTLPCCYWDGGVQDDYNFGNINDYDDVEDLMNHKGYKDLRKKFLKGESHPGCSVCDRHDASDRDGLSGRQILNKTFFTKKTKESIDATKEDGTAIPNIIYLDIRFGNICNLKCRMCSHGLSSSWHEDTLKLYELRGMNKYSNKKFIHSDCFDKIEPYLEHAQEIYFAGGEPLLYPEHTKMLDKLIEVNNTSLKIRYNTNLTSLKSKKRDIIELWKNFDDIQIAASIDGTDDTIEYIRTNADWKTIKDNYEKIKKELPTAQLYPSPTLGIMNVETFPEFNKYCIENEWVLGDSLYLNFINWPKNQDIRILPDWYKDHLCSIYEKHIQWIEIRMDQYLQSGWDPRGIYDNNDIPGYRQVEGLQTIIDYIQEDVYSSEEKKELLDSFWNELNEWKTISPENDWMTSLPHMKQFFDRHLFDI